MVREVASEARTGGSPLSVRLEHCWSVVLAIEQVHGLCVCDVPDTDELNDGEEARRATCHAVVVGNGIQALPIPMSTTRSRN